MQHTELTTTRTIYQPPPPNLQQQRVTFQTSQCNREFVKITHALSLTRSFIRRCTQSLMGNQRRSYTAVSSRSTASTCSPSGACLWLAPRMAASTLACDSPSVSSRGRCRTPRRFVEPGEALSGMPVAAVLIRFDRFDSIAEKGRRGGGGADL
jgi:hypothetical protein